MSGDFGALSVDRLPRSSSDDGATEIEARAEQAAPGEWDENLKAWGVTEWQLPGQGESGPRCGEWYAEAVCESCGHLGAGTHVCGRRSCPDCWGVWAKESAIRASHRVQSFRHTQPDDWHRQLGHAVVSPEEGEVMNERQVWDGRTKAAEIAQEKGFRGCAVIPHLWRVTDEGKERYEAEVPRDEDGNALYGTWVWLRNDVEDMDELIYWSPHYHVIGPTSAGMEPAKESDEWVYNFIRAVQPYTGTRDSESHEDVYGLFRYLLSHTGFPAGSSKQVTTWYGDLANSVFVEDATEDWQHQKPSEGVRSVLKREIEKVAGDEDEDDDDGDGVGDEEGECPEDDCDGVMIDVFDVTAYLRQCDPPPEVRTKMKLARDWRLGEIEPPPGLKRPSTEAELRETWDVMLGDA
jgi:hypothetical protein